MKPERSSATRIACIVCGVTKARRASAAFEAPALPSSKARTRVLRRRQADPAEFGIQAGAKRLLSLLQRKADRGVRVVQARAQLLP